MRGAGRRQPGSAMARRKAASVSELTWCSMPSASIRAVSGLTPSERRKASTVWWRAPALGGDAPALLGQEDPAVGLAGDQAVGGEPRQHLGDRRLRHPQAGGDVDLARLVAVLDQRRDQLDIVLDQRAAVRRARLPEALGMHLGLGERLPRGDGRGGPRGKRRHPPGIAAARIAARRSNHSTSSTSSHLLGADRVVRKRRQCNIAYCIFLRPAPDCKHPLTSSPPSRPMSDVQAASAPVRSASSTGSEEHRRACPRCTPRSRCRRPAAGS